MEFRRNNIDNGNPKDPEKVCAPRIPYGRIWALTWMSGVKNRRLLARAVKMSSSVIYKILLRWFHIQRLHVYVFKWAIARKRNVQEPWLHNLSLFFCREVASKMMPRISETTCTKNPFVQGLRFLSDIW